MSTAIRARVRAAYARIAEVDRPEVWISLRSEEDLRTEAKALEERLAAGATLPLAGSLVAVKDNIDVLGLPTTAGCPAFAYHPEATATAVARLVDAGALVLGKTNLDQFATGLGAVPDPFPNPKGIAVSTPRIRGRLGGAVALSAILALAACGSRVDDSGAASSAASCVDTSGSSVKIGFLDSLSGTMAISEKTVADSLKLAADQINAEGGVLGKQLQVVQEDGASEPTVFAEKAEKLISSDCVAAVFGGWTSSSRKAMLPVFEGANSLLFYPVQYEGLESSPNIFYTGATTNQQIVPALDYLKETGVTSLFLVGSDYVFPRTANKIIKAYADANGIEIKGEEYAPLGHTDFSTIVNKVRSAGAGAVFNTLNGDSNVAFFKEYRNAGLTADAMPVVSVSIAEEEVSGVGVDNLAGQLTAWNYYQTIDSPANKAFVAAFKAEYGQDRVTSDPMEAAYTSLYLWKAMVEKAKSFTTDDVKKAADGVTFDAPEGKVTVNGENHHIAKTALIGKVGADGLIHTVWSSENPIEPDPYLKSYDWAGGLSS